MALEPSGQDSLVVSVSTSSAPDSLRVRVWRNLRSLGARYLQRFRSRPDKAALRAEAPGSGAVKHP